MSDPFDLARFVEAQEPVIARVLAELRAGRKASHWMWFVFPQIAGLGASAMSQRYAIGSRAEAQAYLAHPLLGPRLSGCVAIVNGLKGRTAEEIFGPVDAQKFRSSLTLFAAVAEDPAPFEAALAAYYGGRPDPATLERLRQPPGGPQTSRPRGL